MNVTATKPIKILLQSTTPYAEDDWNIRRFGMVRDYMAALTNDDGSPLADVTARDREPDATGSDPVLSSIDTSDYDQLWIFALDVGDNAGISSAECAAIGRFRDSGGAIFSARDHMNLGASICNIGGIGKAHFFHSRNPDPDPDHNRRDDQDNPNIDYPNYHSGANGDVQTVTKINPVHPVLQNVSTLPAHPHEGGVGRPPGASDARVVVTGTSQVTQRPFNIAVAFESTDGKGRGWAESTFHHFADYNWDTEAGCPSFVTDKPSDRIKKNPSLLDDTKRYVSNLVHWFGRRSK